MGFNVSLDGLKLSYQVSGQEEVHEVPKEPWAKVGMWVKVKRPLTAGDLHEVGITISASKLLPTINAGTHQIYQVRKEGDRISLCGVISDGYHWEFNSKWFRPEPAIIDGFSFYDHALSEEAVKKIFGEELKQMGKKEEEKKMDTFKVGDRVKFSEPADAKAVRLSPDGIYTITEILTEKRMLRLDGITGYFFISRFIAEEPAKEPTRQFTGKISGVTLLPFCHNMIPSVTRIIHNGPVTITHFADDSKIITRPSSDDTEKYDPFVGWCVGMVEKLFGSKLAAKRFYQTHAYTQKPTSKVTPNKVLANKDESCDTCAYERHSSGRFPCSDCSKNHLNLWKPAGANSPVENPPTATTDEHVGDCNYCQHDTESQHDDEMIGPCYECLNQWCEDGSSPAWAPIQKDETKELKEEK